MQKVPQRNSVENLKTIFIYTNGWTKPKVGLEIHYTECSDTIVKESLKWKNDLVLNSKTVTEIPFTQDISENNI